MVAFAVAALLASRDGFAQARADTLEAPPEVDVRVGEAAIIEIVATPALARTWASLPFSLDVSWSPGFEVKRRRWRRVHAEDGKDGAWKFRVPIRAITAGEGSVELALTAWSCARRTCRPVKLSRRVRVRALV